MSRDQFEDVQGAVGHIERSAVATPGVAGLQRAADYESPTIAGLEPQRRPNPLPICATCPHSLWFASAAHLRCFCRLMHVVTWEQDDPSSSIVACDGIVLSEP